MIRISLNEQFEILKNIIVSNSYFLIIGLSFILVAMILINLKRVNKDMAIKSCVGIYIVAMLCIIYEYHDIFGGILDYFVNNVFYKLLFPSLATYGLTIIISNIIILWSLFSKKCKNWLRKVNIFIYCFLSLILFLILNTIDINNIDVYSSVAVYTNKQLFVLIELNMYMFAIWALLLLIVRLFNNKVIVQEKNDYITELEIVNTELPNKFIPSEEAINNFNVKVANIEKNDIIENVENNNVNSFEVPKVEYNNEFNLNAGFNEFAKEFNLY